MPGGDGKPMSKTLHEQIDMLYRAVTAVGRAEEVAAKADAGSRAGKRPVRTGSASSCSSSHSVEPAEAAKDAEAQALAEKVLGRILGRKLPTELRTRLVKLRKRLGARNPEKPRLDLGREILELVDPLGRAGWPDELLGKSLAALPGVGPKKSDGFARRGLERVSDLLFWLPSRYEDRRRVLGVGEIKVGYKADLSIIDLNSPCFVPFNSAARQLVFTEGGQDVETVIIDGRVVMEDRQVTSINERELKDAVEVVMEVVRTDLAAVMARSEEIQPYLLEAWRRSMAADVGLNRFVGNH